MWPATQRSTGRPSPDDAPKGTPSGLAPSASPPQKVAGMAGLCLALNTQCSKGHMAATWQPESQLLS
jgi:hypothetical protein